MVKTLLLKSEIVGSIPTPQISALIMVDSSKWLGGLPLTQRIAGSSPLSTTKFGGTPIYLCGCAVE